MGFLDDLDRIDKEKSLMASEPQGGFLARLNAIDAEMQNKPISSTVKDIGVSVGAGVPNLLGTIADVADMVTGDSIDTIGQVGDFFKGVGQQITNEGLSPEALAQRQAISQAVADENAGLFDLAKSVVLNPLGTATMAAESAPTAFVPIAGGVAAAKAAPLVGKVIPKVANALTPARAGAIGATGSNALLNAGDTFGELEGQPLVDRYAGAAVPFFVSSLVGPGMESMPVNRLIGAVDTPVSKGIKDAFSNLGKGALKGGAKEFVSEAGEGGSQAVGEAIGKGEEINPTQVAKQAALEGALGAGPGAVGGGLSNVKMAEQPSPVAQQIENTVAKLVEDAQKNQAKPEDVAANVLKALGGLSDKYEGGKPQEQVDAQPMPEPTQEVAPVAEAQETTKRIDRGILQNRKRDDKDSVNQMRKIANAPDYGRVGYSRDFANGAPVVAFGSIPEEQKGRTDYAVSVTGERIPVQYAVVDADTVSTSNDINGAENPDYGLTDRVTAIAGNGRMTALGQAYRQGSAQAYRQEMTEDTMHGVNPQVIAKMKNPVLVRIMPNERVRDDVGDMSNISSNKSLSAIEMARNDANRVDLDSLEFNDDGTPTRDSLSRFVSGMPDTERGSMMDKEGRATVQAVDRLNNAIFAKAYNNDDITAMYAEATDPEAKLVVNALARLAPKMAKLEGCGELDFRDALVDAVNAIVQGKRKGLKMQDILAQQDFLADPDVALFIELFARNSRSNKDAVAILSAAADFAYSEATKPSEDMFGEVQKASRADVMNYARDEFNKVKEVKNGKQAKQQAAVQDASGSIGTSQNVDWRNAGANQSTNERAGLADSQANEGFSLSGQTEQEIIADEKAEEERQAAAKRQEEADAKQQAKEDFNKEVDSLNESYAENFSLEDDTVSAEDALRGQKPLFSKAGDDNARMREETSHLRRLDWEIRNLERSLKAIREQNVKSIAAIPSAMYEEFGLGYGTMLNSFIRKAKEDNEGKRVNLAMVVAEVESEIASLKEKLAKQQEVVDALGGSDALSDQKLLFSRNPRTGKMDIKLSIVWHGSPHVFEVFLTDHIGTGEGAQAHGWGLYFAKDRDVAASYRKRLSRNQGGEDYEIYIGRREASEFYSWVEDQANRSKSMEEARKWYDRLAVVEDLLAFEDASEVEARWEQYGEDAYTKEAYDWFNKEVKPKIKQPGRLFKLEIPDENLMLDEQKQFKDQPKHVQDALNRVVDNLIAEGIVDESFRDFIKNESGWGIYWSIGQKYDAKYGDDFDSLKAASLALNAEGIPGITYMGEEDGRCYVVFDDAAVKVLNYYSKNKPEESTSGSTVEDVTETLGSDKEVGGAFNALQESGEVTVVQSVEDLPEEIKRVIKASSDEIESDKEDFAAVKEEVKAKVRTLLEQRGNSDVVVKSDGLNVSVAWSGAKHTINYKGQTWKDLLALLHVHDLVESSAFENKEPDRLGRRDPYATSHYSAKIDIDGDVYPVRIVVRHHSDGKNNFYNLGVERENPEATRERHTQELGTTPFPSSGIKNSVGRGEIVVKRSDNGDIQGLYDPRTGKAYLIADALTDKTAKPVFLHELGVHASYSKNPLKLESQMKLARNMVNNGYAQGNDIAVRVKQRLFDANEIDSMDAPIPMDAAEECMSYLVEETASTDDRGPFRKWFDSVITAIKQWLRSHGINVNLNEWDFVEIAKGNVVAMARQSGKEMKLSYSKKGKKGPTSTPPKGPAPQPKGGRFLERDELGRFRLKAGRKLIEGLGYTVAAADSFLPVAYKMQNAPQALRIQIREMKAKIEKAGMDATEMAQLMKEMPEAERKLISDVVEQELAPGVNPPSHVLQIATKITQIMDDQAQELVDLGMLSQESYDRYRGKYLPRFYLRANDQEAIGFFAKIFGPKARMRGVAGTHLKGRGMFKEVPAKAAHNFIKLGWEVRDPRYEYVNGKVQPKQGQISGVDDTGVVMLWRDYRKDEREQMGEIRDASYRFAIGYMETQRDLAIGRLFKAIASNPEWTSAQPREGFAYIPKNEVPDAGGVLKYGALAGKYVDEVVLSHISHIEDVPDGFVRAFRQGMAFWKEGKTAMNPVSHMNNTVGNFVAAHLAGVDMWDAKAYAKALHSLRTNDASFKEAQDAGLFSGSFSREEFVQSLPEDLKHLAEQEEGGFKKFSDTLMRVFTWGLRDKLRNAYEFEDAFFKMAIYQKAREAGMDPQHAVDYAHKFVFVYDTLPEGARKLRNSLFPFFAWTYQAVPMLATAAVCYPWRFFAPAAILFALNKAFFLAAAGDDDDTWAERWKKASQLEDAERTLLPKYMQGNTLFMTPKFLRLGIDEATGLPQYINLSHMVPGGNFLDFENQMGGVPLPEIMTPNHPLLNAFMAYIGNRDMFSGFDMTKRTDDTGETVQKYAEYTWKQLTPAIAIGNYHWGRLMDGVAGATGVTMPIDRTGVNRHGEVMPLSVAIQNMVGLKVRTFDPDNELNRQLRGHKSDVSMIQSEKRSAYRRARAGALPIDSYQDFAKTADEKVRKVRGEMGEIRKARATVKDLSGK